MQAGENKLVIILMFHNVSYRQNIRFNEKGSYKTKR